MSDKETLELIIDSLERLKRNMHKHGTNSAPMEQFNEDMHKLADNIEALKAREGK